MCAVEKSRKVGRVPLRALRIWQHPPVTMDMVGFMSTSQERGRLDPSQYHDSPREQTRIADLLSLVPQSLDAVLDIGSRYGYITKRLADRARDVTALDLELPEVDDPRVRCVKGDATALPFDDSSFDLVFCAEVLEHLPGRRLEKACAEIARVTRRHVIIGVPYRQDLRLWRTTCLTCKGLNPPWAHVNSFDEANLSALFPGLEVERQSFVETAELGTNAASAWLMNQAGNPYGTYVQDESCVLCGVALAAPAPMKLGQRLLSKAALSIRQIVNLTRKPHSNWMHVLMSKS